MDKRERVFLRGSDYQSPGDFFSPVFGVGVPGSALSKPWAFSGQVRNYWL